jgi:HTH-type transcriptional regulator, competence development regulator
MEVRKTPAEFGGYLKSVRETAGLTLRDVEDRSAGVVKNGYLSQIEKGLINRPSPGILFELAEVYGVSYRVLLIYAGHRVPEEEVVPELRAIADLPLRAFAELDAEDRQALIEYAAFLRQRKKGR